MSERLVTQDDLNRFPELKSMGVSVNQHFDVDAYAQLHSNSTPPVVQVRPIFQRQAEVKPMIPEVQKVEKPVAEKKAKAPEVKAKVKEPVAKPKVNVIPKKAIEKIKKGVAPKKITKGKGKK